MAKNPALHWTTVKCPTCYGSGKRGIRKCTLCKGKGLIRVPPLREIGELAVKRDVLYSSQEVRYRS